MPHKPIKIDPNREFCGKKLGVYVPKPKPAVSETQDTKPETQDSGLKTQNPLTENLIRGPKLEVFIPRKPGATMEEALVKAEKENRVIASNKRLDQIFVGGDEWKSIKAALWCWSGTMTAYEEPGKKFGKTVEYVDDKTKIRYVFEVPSQYVGEKDSILVAEHPDYKLENDGNNRIIRTAFVDLIARFPAESNKWYLTDPKHGIPIGEQVKDSDSNARYLWRIEKRVGLSARGYSNVCYRSVYLSYAPSVSIGVAIEAPERGTQKK